MGKPGEITFMQKFDHVKIISLNNFFLKLKMTLIFRLAKKLYCPNGHELATLIKCESGTRVKRMSCSWRADVIIIGHNAMV